MPQVAHRPPHARRSPHAHGAPRPRPAPAATPPAGRLAPQDVDVLVRAVAAEARGESPAVWAGVAQAIINYARRTGRAIRSVARSSYLSSNHDANRRYYTMPLARIPNLAGIRAAVEAAAAGRSPVGGRSHFHDVRIDTPAWGDRATRLPIGRMVFYEPK